MNNLAPIKIFWGNMKVHLALESFNKLDCHFMALQSLTESIKGYNLIMEISLYENDPLKPVLI